MIETSVEFIKKHTQASKMCQNTHNNNTEQSIDKKLKQSNFEQIIPRKYFWISQRQDEAIFIYFTRPHHWGCIS